ncbi:MAG: tetratricopeptide repeat protein [Bacteroidia bacterium]|nr:tetratricopeptide repeat protein [Bacteroidia bacterium]MDW8235933.1 tetratricopeptide repeat protein [Bacteroidia bacterium]
MLWGVLGLSCQSPQRNPPSADSIAAADTASGWTGFLTRSFQAIERGDTQQALALVEKAIRQDTQQPFIYEVKGYYAYMQGKDEEALRYYRKALELGGVSPQLHYRMGSAYLMRQQWQESYYHLTKALAADSQKADYWTALGLWAYAQKRLQEAKYYWQKALSCDSTHDKARSFLYDLYLNDFASPESARIYYLDPYWKKDRFNALLNFQMGNYFLKKLQMNPPRRGEKLGRQHASYAYEAIEAYTRSILAHPSYAQAYYNRGYIFFLVEKYDKALEDFVKAAELQPQDARAHFMAGSLSEYKGDLTRARTFYQKALSIDSTLQDARKALQEIERKR